MRFRPESAILALAFLLAPGGRAQEPFTRVPISLPQGVVYESVAAADYDGDGDLDVPLGAGEARVFEIVSGGLPSGVYVVQAVGETFLARRAVTLLK
jgi:hypothetical protein